jgi:hypothetical protein
MGDYCRLFPRIIHAKSVAEPAAWCTMTAP